MLLRGPKASITPVLRHIEQLQTMAFAGASPSTEKVTAPQWQLPS
jgi:hypothetical protein